MTRTAFVLLLALASAGCGARTPPPAVAEPPFRSCQPLSPALPKVRTVEALARRNAELEAKYPDCAERLRRVVEAWPAP